MTDTDTATVDLETMARLPSFASPRVSPAGDELLFYHDRSGRMELYAAPLDERGSSPTDPEAWTQLSDGDVPRNPEGRLSYGQTKETVYFHLDDAGDEQHDLYALDRDGETRPVFETDGMSFLVSVTDDGTLVCVSDHGGQLNLYRVDPESGSEAALTSLDRPVFPDTVAVSPDDGRVAFVTTELDTTGRRGYVLPLDSETADPRRLDFGTDGSRVSVGGWVDDDRLFVGDDTADCSRVGVYSLGSGETEWLSDGSVVEEPQTTVPGGDRVIALRTRRAAQVPVVYDLTTGRGSELDVPEGVVGPPSRRADAFQDDETVTLEVAAGDRRTEVWAYDLRTDESRRLLSADHGPVSPDYFVAPEYVRYDSVDDTEIGGLLYETPHAEEPAPAVVKVHGGPTIQSQRSFDVYTQFLVSEGYTVLEPNYRGSTGRGRAFRTAIDRDWGGAEQVDIRRGAEWLAAERAVDPDRIAVMGSSYGGYSAYCQLTMHPAPWAAGVAHVGITDLLRLYEHSIPGNQAMLERFLGDPTEHEAFYRERSPIEHVENTNGPLQIIHGVSDPRCPVSQARRFRDALEEAGRSEPEDFEYHELDDEGHGSTDQAQRLRAFELLADFLGRRL